jgi:hypothetical protein
MSDRDPRIRFDRSLPPSGPKCDKPYGRYTDVRCGKPARHDEPYYHYFDHGQTGYYDDEPTMPDPRLAAHEFAWTDDEAPSNSNTPKEPTP